MKIDFVTIKCDTCNSSYRVASIFECAKMQFLYCSNCGSANTNTITDNKLAYNVDYLAQQHDIPLEYIEDILEDYKNSDFITFASYMEDFLS